MKRKFFLFLPVIVSMFTQIVSAQNEHAAYNNEVFAKAREWNRFLDSNEWRRERVEQGKTAYPGYKTVSPSLADDNFFWDRSGETPGELHEIYAQTRKDRGLVGKNPFGIPNNFKGDFEKQVREARIAAIAEYNRNVEARIGVNKSNGNSKSVVIDEKSVDLKKNSQPALNIGAKTVAADDILFESDRYAASRQGVGHWKDPKHPRILIEALGFAPGLELDRATDVSVMLTAQDALMDKLKVEGSSQHNVMLTEGGMSDLRDVMADIAGNTTGKTTLVVTLGVGYEPPGSKDSGVRAASALAKYLALNPELITKLEARGVHFQAYDKNTGKSFATLAEFYKSDSWKSINKRIASATKVVSQPEFESKLNEIEKLEKKLESTTDKVDKNELKFKLAELKSKIALTQGYAFSEKIVAETILSITHHYTGETIQLLSKNVIEKSGLDAGIKFDKAAGKAVDPAAAARTTGKGVK